MSEIFAEATVTLLPDTKGFAKALQAQVKEIIDGIEASNRAPKIRVAPALTKNFIGSLRTQVNAAVERAQVGVKPIRVSVALAPLPAGQLREIQQASRVVGAGGTGGAAASARELAAANTTLAPTQQRVNALFAQGAVDLGVFTQAEDEAAAKSRTRGRGAQDSAQRAKGRIDQTRSERLLAEARTDVAAATNADIPKEQQLALLRGAGTKAARAEVLALQEVKAALTDDARIRGQVAHANAGLLAQNVGRELESQAAAQQRERDALRASTVAQRENTVEASRSARTQAQLRRGALATSLSFLGIRGATLAASASFLAGAAAISVFAKALQSATAFSDQLNVFRATTGATAKELEQVRDSARALGADLTLPGVTAASAAEAMTELAKAGLDVQQSIAGARGVLQLATAAAIDNAQAVELVANALNAFGLQGKQATQVADTFANAANAAQGSIVDIGIAFQQSAAAGRQVGLSFQDTTLFLTTLARAGLKGSDAGTSLRTALIRLINPSKEAQAALDKLGVQLRDEQGNLRPDVFIQLASALKNVSPAQRDATVALIGGQDAFRAISILGRQSIDDFIKLRRELRQQGTAADLAAARMQGLRGSLEGLSNLLSTIGIRIGKSLTAPLQGTVDGLAAFTQQAANSDQVARTLQGVLDAATTSFALLAGALQAVATVAVPAASGLEQVVNAVGITNIVAAIAAYKLLPVAMSAVTFSANVLRNALFRLGFAFGTIQALGLRAGLASIISGFNVWAIAIAAVAGGLAFLLTRETEAEKVTRRFADSTNALVDAHVRLNQAVSTRNTAGPGANQARLDLLNAQQAQANAQAAVGAAPRGTQERVRANLQLRVAIDNVTAAQQRLNDAQKEANDAQIVFLNAQRREQEARQQSIEDTQALAREQLILARNQLRANAREANQPGARGREQVLAARDFVDQLDKQIAKLRESDDIESLVQANRLERLRNITALVQRVPSEKAIEIAINTGNASKALRLLIQEFGITGNAAIQALRFALEGEGSRQIGQAMQSLIDSIVANFQEPWRAAGERLGAEHGHGIAAGIAASAPEVTAASAGLVTKTVNQLKGLERAGVALEISGASLGARLANARAQEANARATLALLKKQGASEGSIAKQQQVVLDKQNQVQAIEAEIQQNQDEADQKAKTAADKHDKAVLDLLERRRSRVQDRISDAQETETLADDLQRTIALRNLIRKQINRIRDLVKDRQAQADAIRDLQATERDLNREIGKLQKDRRQQISDRIAESIQLDIDFAQTTKNQALEIRARRREIERLKKLQAGTKAGTVEWKRYRNLIAEQNAAIKAVTSEQKKKLQALQAQEFAFLQTIQGFTFNLLGNLIPGFATGGLVGRTAGGAPSGFPTPGSGLRQVSGGFEQPHLPPGFKGADLSAGVAISSAATKTQPVTAGQGNTQIHWLRMIFHELHKLNAGRDHPEAHNQRRQGTATGDYSAGGAGSSALTL